MTIPALKGALLASSFLVLCGCAGTISGGDAEGALNELRARISSIQPGDSNRDSVRSVLGAPYAASAVWNLDFFRTEARSTSTVFAFTPWPIPMAHYWDQIVARVLVAYSQDGVVTAVNHGAIGTGRGQFLRAGDFVLHVDNDAKAESLLLPADRIGMLADRLAGSGHCAIIVGVLGTSTVSALSVDEISSPWWPLLRSQVLMQKGSDPPDRSPRGFSFSNDASAAAFVVPAGTHLVSIASAQAPPSDAVKCECGDGEVVTIAADIRVERAGSSPASAGTPSSSFRVVRGSSSEFSDRYLVIYRGGRWLADWRPAGPQAK